MEQILINERYARKWILQTIFVFHAFPFFKQALPASAKNPAFLYLIQIHFLIIFPILRLTGKTPLVKSLENMRIP